jgi:chromosome segregation ATPase
MVCAWVLRSFCNKLAAAKAEADRKAQYDAEISTKEAALKAKEEEIARKTREINCKVKNAKLIARENALRATEEELDRKMTEEASRAAVHKAREESDRIAKTIHKIKEEVLDRHGQEDKAVAVKRKAEEEAEQKGGKMPKAESSAAVDREGGVSGLIMVGFAGGVIFTPP